MDHTRHMNIFDAKDTSIKLVGAGGIGSTTALVLAKMGVGFLDIYDSDVVGEENLATQLHKLSDLGKPKVEGVAETVRMFSDDCDIMPYQQRISSNDGTLMTDIIISGVDSIKSRQLIWMSVRESRPRHYIDARMAAEELQLYYVDMRDTGNVARYEEMVMLEDDSKVPDLPCTEKATFYCSAVIAGFIGSYVRKILTYQDLPFRLVYNLVTNIQVVIE